ncbi:MAG: ABC transporter permease [Erysipelotrichaceae bacterium]|jgi:NitT/TauT family transport system permease protein|nr:ABC transporter permease [Erysipelotrichaceae bacterium]
MKKSKIYIELCALVIALIALWQAITVIFDIPSYYLPSPVEFFTYFSQFLQTGKLASHISTTLYEVFIGTFWGIVVGMVLGYFIAKSKVLEHLLMPLLLIMQISPKISIAPLFILWFGLGLTSKVALVILVVSFPIMIAESSALKKINSGYTELMNIWHANKWQVFTRVELPCACHEVISGIKIAVTQAITSAVIGEMMGAKAGLGYLLTNGAEMYDLNMILSSIFLLSLLGLFLYEICQVVERKVLYWK